MSDTPFTLPPPLESGKGSCEVIIHRMQIVGHTVSGTHLSRLVHIPDVHRPILFGIPRPAPVSGYQVRRAEEMLSSGWQLMMLLATRSHERYFPQAPQFALLLIKEAVTDSGHFVSFTLALIMALRSGRSDLAVEGVFGAGKTTSLAYMLAWFALTTNHARITVMHKENPAGQAIASMIARMPLPYDYRHRIVRIVSMHAYTKEEHFPIDAPSNDCRARTSRAKVLICTTGIIDAATESNHYSILDHVADSSIAVHEEAQQQSDIKGAHAQALPKSGRLHIAIGDVHQSQGGIEDHAITTKHARAHA